MIDLGQGAPENPAEAERWFRLASGQGIALAQYELAIRYDRNATPDHAEAVKWYRLAAEQGHVPSQERLARIYQDGVDLPKDYAESAKWYRLLGDAQNLGYIYEQGGFGVARDFAEAVKWYRRSADTGSASGQLSLGLMYLKGQGVAQDEGEARKWIALAADQGEAVAQMQLGLLYANGQGGAQNYVEAHLWLNVAANSLSAYPQGREQAVRNREIVAAKMTQAQLAQAQGLASQCRLQNFKTCGTLTADSAETSVEIATGGSGARKIVLLENDSGTYRVRVVVNDVIALNFMLDTGASDVSIPANVLATLMETGTVNDSDYRGTRTYVLADGSKIPARTFRIRTLKVGDVIMENVIASIAPSNGGLLLGQSFLGRLKSWSIDNSAHALIIN
jgi:clan AA aspartic protease (TIGR02281 family)